MVEMRIKDNKRISIVFAVVISLLLHAVLVVLITTDGNTPTDGEEHGEPERLQEYRVLENLRHRLVKDPLREPPLPEEVKEVVEDEPERDATPPPEAIEARTDERADSPQEQPEMEKEPISEEEVIEVIEVDAELIKKGKELAGERGEELGSFPPLEASYKDIGFWNYMAHIKRLGGRFFILDRRKGSLVSEVNPTTRTFSEPHRLNGLSPRSRDLSDEVALRGILVQANRRFGQAPYSIIFLLPLDLDAALVGAQAKALEGNLKDYRKVYGNYEVKGSRIALRLTSAETRTGERIPLNSLINLGRWYRG